MAERPRRGVLRSAGHGALTVLRRTTLRAKLGSLHLPLDLHPGRQRTILLPPSPATAGDGQLEGELPDHGTTDASGGVAPPAASERDAATTAVGMRALRSRLGASERRVARLRQALERERRARQQGAATLIAPERLIEQLVADLHQTGASSPELLHATVTRVLAAHGIAASGVPASGAARGAGYATGSAGPPGIGGARTEPALPVLPGWDPARLAAIVAALTRQPEIGGVRTLHLALCSMACGDPLGAAEAAKQAGLTSAMARHRMRLALEGLCAAGVLRRQGERFALRAPNDRER